MKNSMMILILCVVMCIGMLTGCQMDENNDGKIKNDYSFDDTLAYIKKNGELHMVFDASKSPHDVMILRDTLGDMQWCWIFGDEDCETIYLNLIPYLGSQALYASNRDGSGLTEIITEIEDVYRFDGMYDKKQKQYGNTFFFVMYEFKYDSYDLYICIEKNSRLIAANIRDYFPSPDGRGVYVVYDRKEFYECKYIEINEELLDTEKSVDFVSVSENIEVLEYYINDGGNSLIMLGRDGEKYAIWHSVDGGKAEKILGDITSVVFDELNGTFAARVENDSKIRNVYFDGEKMRELNPSWNINRSTVSFNTDNKLFLYKGNPQREDGKYIIEYFNSETSGSVLSESLMVVFGSIDKERDYFYLLDSSSKKVYLYRPDIKEAEPFKMIAENVERMRERNGIMFCSSPVNDNMRTLVKRFDGENGEILFSTSDLNIISIYEDGSAASPGKLYTYEGSVIQFSHNCKEYHRMKNGNIAFITTANELYIFDGENTRKLAENVNKLFYSSKEGIKFGQSSGIGYYHYHDYTKKYSLN